MRDVLTNAAVIDTLVSEITERASGSLKDMTTNAQTAPDRPVVRPDLLAALEDGGYRITQPRLSLIAHLEHREGGFSADEICGELPSIGRATVYRTIRILSDAGAICKLAMPDGQTKYSMSRIEHHHHTLCVQCGYVGEFRHASIERLLRAIGREISGEIVGHRIEVFTICEDCPADRESDLTPDS